MEYYVVCTPLDVKKQAGNTVELIGLSPEEIQAAIPIRDGKMIVYKKREDAEKAARESIVDSATMGATVVLIDYPGVKGRESHTHVFKDGKKTRKDNAFSVIATNATLKQGFLSHVDAKFDKPINFPVEHKYGQPLHSKVVVDATVTPNHTNHVAEKLANGVEPVPAVVPNGLFGERGREVLDTNPLDLSVSGESEPPTFHDAANTLNPSSAAEQLPPLPLPSELHKPAASVPTVVVTTIVETLNSDVTPPAETPRTDVTPPVEMPKADVTPPVEMPKADAIPPVETPRTDATPPVETPRTDATPPADTLSTAPASLGLPSPLAQQRPLTGELDEERRKRRARREKEEEKSKMPPSPAKSKNNPNTPAPTETAGSSPRRKPEEKREPRKEPQTPPPEQSVPPAPKSQNPLKKRSLSFFQKSLFASLLASGYSLFDPSDIIVNLLSGEGIGGQVGEFLASWGITLSAGSTFLYFADAVVAGAATMATIYVLAELATQTVWAYERFKKTHKQRHLDDVAEAKQTRDSVLKRLGGSLKGIREALSQFEKTNAAAPEFDAQENLVVQPAFSNLDALYAETPVLRALQRFQENERLPKLKSLLDEAANSIKLKV